MAACPEQRREQFVERPLPSSEESERAILGHGAGDAGQRGRRIRGSLEPRQARGWLERLAARRHPADALVATP